MTKANFAKRGRLNRAASLLVTYLFIFSVGAPGFAQQAPGIVDLSPPEARQVARQAALSGNFQLADILSSALLSRDPDDAEALLVRALVARSAGRLDDAHAAASRAYRVSDNPVLRFDAAILAADFDARRERYTRAQIWLRRADQVAPDNQRRNVAANAYRQLTQRNPLSFQLRFTAKPSNNVNNGAETGVIEIGGLPFLLDPSGLQLGGYEASGGLSFSYRISESETQMTQVVGDVFTRKIWLDDDAKDAAPSASGSDYDYSAIVAGIRHRRMFWPEIGPSQITGVVGQSWYGGEKLARWGELTFGQTVLQGERRSLNLATTIRDEKRLDDDVNSSQSLALAFDMFRPIESGGNYSLGATVKNVWSDSATVDLASLSLRASRAFSQIGPIRPSVSASVQQRIYHKFDSVPGGREDLSVSLSLNAVWPEVSYFGFVPQMTVTGRRTYSNVDIYDRNEFSVGLTAVSRF